MKRAKNKAGICDNDDDIGDDNEDENNNKIFINYGVVISHEQLSTTLSWPISSMCSSLLRTVFAGVQRLALTHTQFWPLMMGRLVGGAT